MKRLSGGIGAVLFAAVVVACSSAPREPVSEGVQPATPADASRQPAAGGQTGGGERRYTEADVRFMQHMIAHHAQALAMTSLVPARSNREDLGLLAQRIEVSQEDEIALMQRWLRERGEEVPDVQAHAGHQGAGAGHVHMPGMLTPEQMAQLAAASGAEFDRLFLEFMIQHHEGALVMVADLFASEGAGQDSEVFRIASDVDADQRTEIARMRSLQNAPPSGAQPR